jgi:hypothetical protein
VREQRAIPVGLANGDYRQVMIGQNFRERKIGGDIKQIERDIRSFDQKFQGIVFRQIAGAQDREQADLRGFVARRLIKLLDSEGESLQGEAAVAVSHELENGRQIEQGVCVVIIFGNAIE